MSAKTVVGSGAKILGAATWFICGLVGFVWILALISKQYGLFVAILAFIFFPATTFVGAIWAWASLGEWAPAAIIYGGAAAGFVIGMLGQIADPN